MRLQPMFESFKKIPTAKVAGGVALISTLLVIYLHVVFGMHAGALWRDEVTSLEIATMRTFSEMWSNLSFDSFPVLFLLVLRVVAGVPETATDAELRILGITVGLLIMGAIWLNSRWLRLGFPLVSLALIGLNPMIIRYGDSIRAYGLGIALVLLALGAMWRLVESFTPGRAAIATLSAILSVQCLYHNSILLFAICLGAAAVTAHRRQFKQMFFVLLLGAISAASLLPYVPMIQRVHSWNFVWKAPFTLSVLWRKLAEMLGSPVSLGVWAWIALFFLAVLGGIWTFSSPSEKNAPGTNRDRVLFAVVTLLIGTVGYGAFLRVLGYAMRPWYYIVFAAFAATCIELIFASVSGARWLLAARTAFALIFTGVTIYPAAQALQFRQTNIDLIATHLQSLASRDDLILINPWFYAISFRHHYHGLTLCTTIPPIQDLRSHRVDIFVRQMMSPATMRPVLQTMGDTLRAGHAIWLVGPLDFLPSGQTPRSVPPWIDGANDWNAGDFSRMWSEQAGFFVQKHAVSFERVQVPNKQLVNRYENVPLSVIRGWHEGQTASQ